MSAQQHLSRLVDPRREMRRPPLVGMEFLHQAPVRGAHGFGARSRFKAKDLIGFLLGHRAGARARARPGPQQ